MNYFIPNNLYKFINKIKIIKLIIIGLSVFPLINIFELYGMLIA